jgi:hypothetical protein
MLIEKIMRRLVTFDLDSSWMASVLTLNRQGKPKLTAVEFLTPLAWNAPIAITVSRNKTPLFGIGVELRGAVLVVCQLQGVKGTNPHPQFADLLVEGCMHHAMSMGMAAVRIAPPERDYFSFYTPTHCADPSSLRAYQERMVERIKKIALNQGFSRTPDGWWEWRPPRVR